jgi:hypothetical protein
VAVAVFAPCALPAGRIKTAHLFFKRCVHSFHAAAKTAPICTRAPFTAAALKQFSCWSLVVQGTTTSPIAKHFQND